jgi:hypothetical protein
MTDHAASLRQQVHGGVGLGTAAHRSPLGWLKEYGQDASIALFTLAAIASHLVLRYVWKVPAFDCFASLFIRPGGVAPIVGSIRRAHELEGIQEETPF